MSILRIGDKLECVGCGCNINGTVTFIDEFVHVGGCNTYFRLEELYNMIKKGTVIHESKVLTSFYNTLDEILK